MRSKDATVQSYCDSQSFTKIQYIFTYKWIWLFCFIYWDILCLILIALVQKYERYMEVCYFLCFRTYRGLFSRVSSSCKLSQKYKHEYSSTDINISLFQWDVGIRQETESIGLHRSLTGIKRDEMRTRSRPVSCWQEEEWWRRLNFWPAAGSEYIPAGFFFYVHFLFESSHATYLLWWGTPAICPLMIPHVSRSNLALIPTNPSAQTQTGAKGVYV